MSMLLNITTKAMIISSATALSLRSFVVFRDEIKGGRFKN